MRQPLLTGEIKEFIHARPWPGGNRLIFDVFEEDYVGEEYLPHLAFVLYRDNFNLFDSDEQFQIATIFQQIHGELRKRGIPTTLEVKASIHESS